MNVLIEFGSGAEDFDDEVYSELLNHINVENCAVIHNNKEKIRDRQISRYITHSFYAPPICHGDYSEAIAEFGEGYPVDSELLDSFSQNESEIITMLLRWSEGDYSALRRDYCNHLRFWNHVLDTLDIDAFFTTEIIHAGYNYIIYLLCKKKNIKYFSTQRVSFPERLHVAVDVYDQLPYFSSEYDALYEKYRDQSIEDIVLRDDIQEMYYFYTEQEDRTPTYMINTTRSRRRPWAIWAYDSFKICRWLFDVYTNNNDFGKKTRAFARRMRHVSFLLLNLFSYNVNVAEYGERYVAKSFAFREIECLLRYFETKAEAVDYSKNYIYFPLHYQPEQTTSPLGGRYVDQILAIKMLSYYLPKGWLIYIKDHPSFKDYNSVPRATWRSKKFYDELLALGNVKFASMKENTFSLIENSRAVAVVTGTAGLEAITRGIPCIMFGFGYLQYAPNVKVVRNNSDCKEIMSLISNGYVEEDLRKKIKVYFKALEEYFFYGKIVWYDAKYRKNYTNDRIISRNNIVQAYKKELRRVFGDFIFKDN